MHDKNLEKGVGARDIQSLFFPGLWYSKEGKSKSQPESKYSFIERIKTNESTKTLENLRQNNMK